MDYEIVNTNSGFNVYHFKLKDLLLMDDLDDHCRKESFIR